MWLRHLHWLLVLALIPLAFILLQKSADDRGDRLQQTLENATEEEQECRSVYLGDTSEKGTRIGVEFLSPSPRFWGVEFAPQDWPARPSSRPVA